MSPCIDILSFRIYLNLTLCSVYIAGQVLKKSLATYPDKVTGQEAVSNKKAQLIYAALEAHPDAYKIVPDKSARSRMNICFRVTKVSSPCVLFTPEIMQV